CDSRDGVSLFNHKSGVSTAPAATADSTVRSQWTTRDAVARLAVRSHLPPAERAHFGQYKTAQSLYDAVVARYSSPATAALSRLMLPYLFLDLAAFATVADLVSHLRTSDARYRAALPTEGVPLSPFSRLLLLLLQSTSLALRRSELRLPLVGDAATAKAMGARVVEGTAGAAAEAVEEAEGVVVEVGVVPGVGASVAAVEVVEAAAEVVEAAAAVAEVAVVVVLVEVQPRSVEALVVASASSSRVPMRPRRFSSFVSGTLGVGGLGNVAIFDLDFDAILTGAGGGTGAVSAVSGGTARPRPYFVPLLQQVLGLPPSPGPTPPLLSPPPVSSQSPLQPSSPLPGPSPYSGPTIGLKERREPESRPVSPVSHATSPIRTACAGRILRPRPPPVPGTHSMTLSPSTAPQRVPLPSPPASSLPDGPDPESDSLRAASPTVTRFLATAVTDPLFESSAASALVAELSESASVCPPSVGDECALGTDRQEEFEYFAATVPHLVSMLLAHEGDPDAPDILTPRSDAEAIEGPYSSQWQAPMDAEMASWKSTGTYVDEVPPPGANIVSGMWIFRVKRPPGSPPAFKARYVARGFSQRQGVDFFQTFSPTSTMTTLRHSLHEEIWLRRPPGFTGSFPAGTQWSLRRPVYGLRQAP
ncbi:unnamed protein product, partial [Closterium sp. NIES-53]